MNKWRHTSQNDSTEFKVIRTPTLSKHSLFQKVGNFFCDDDDERNGKLVSGGGG